MLKALAQTLHVHTNVYMYYDDYYVEGVHVLYVNILLPDSFMNKSSTVPIHFGKK